MMRSLDFYGMPHKFNNNMTLNEGENPDVRPDMKSLRKKIKPETMAIIDPHGRL